MKSSDVVTILEQHGIKAPFVLVDHTTIMVKTDCYRLNFYPHTFRLAIKNLDQGDSSSAQWAEWFGFDDQNIQIRGVNPGWWKIHKPAFEALTNFILGKMNA